MLRSLVKHAVARAVEATDPHRRSKHSPRSARPPLVVGYHKVVAEFREGRYEITPLQISCGMLERHLDWIGAHYDFVSLDDLGVHLVNGEPFPRPVAAVTFDDGYRDVYRNAFPLLKRKGIPAAAFVVTDAIGSGAPLVHDSLYFFVAKLFDTSTQPVVSLAEALSTLGVHPETAGRILHSATNPFTATRALLFGLRQSDLRRLISAFEAVCPLDPAVLDAVRPMTWDMVMEMSKSGITIGSHTKSHVLLTRESSRTVQEEIGDSKRILESQLGIPLRHFAYPDGRFNTYAARTVADSGYSFAYTICRHREPGYPFMTIPRKLLWEKSCIDSTGKFSPAIMNCQARGIFDWFTGCDQTHSGGPADAPAAVGAVSSKAKRVSLRGGRDR